LWPSSREKLPKQFLPIFGGRTLFDLTLERVTDNSLFAPPIIVSALDLGELVCNALDAARIPGRVILEPCRRNSAAAIAVAIEAHNADASCRLMLVLAADHFIPDAEAFRTAVRESMATASQGKIITFGIQPDSAHTGYGYIRRGQDFGNGICAIERFVEKPSPEIAKGLIEERCLWNSGNFLFNVEIMREEIERFEPRVARVAREAARTFNQTVHSPAIVEQIAEAVFSHAPSISIDHAVLERTERGACKVVDYTWSDLGTWDSLWKTFAKDGSGNATRGNVSLLDTTQSLVMSEGPHLAVVGLDDIVVVATGDAVLVAPRTVNASLGTLVSELKAAPETQALAVSAPQEFHDWGNVRCVAQELTCRAQITTLKPGKSTPLQILKDRNIHCTVLVGQVTATIDQRPVEVDANKAFHIPDGASYRVSNSGECDALWFELIPLAPPTSISRMCPE
jgi:mannose-1-phosphate guanylyltransferase/mannose-6-phosphate isomerase